MDLDLRGFLSVVAKRRVLVALIMIVSLAAASYRTLRTDPIYEAEATLIVGIPQVSRDDLTQGAALIFLARQLQETYAELAKDRSIAEDAIETDDLNVSPAVLKSAVSAEPVQNTQLITLTFRSTDPAFAQRALNSVARALIREAAAETSQAAVPLKILSPAIRPIVPVAPNVPLNIALGGLLGVLLGVAAAVATEFMDVTVRDRETAEKSAGAPVLAQIPRVKIPTGTWLEKDTQSPAAESFRKVRTALQFLSVDDEMRTLLVTSARSSEGKTTVALNLAASFAQAGKRTVLVEADLRRPTIEQILPETKAGRGLTYVLLGRVDAESAAVSIGIPNLSVIPAGALPPNPAELLASKRMVDLLDQLEMSYDQVIVDAPPLLPVADASALAPRVSGVVLVARAGSTSRERLHEAAGAVRSVGGRVLGVVLNFSKAGGGRDDPYTYYRYTSSP